VILRGLFTGGEEVLGVARQGTPLWSYYCPIFLVVSPITSIVQGTTRDVTLSAQRQGLILRGLFTGRGEVLGVDPQCLEGNSDVSSSGNPPLKLELSIFPWRLARNLGCAGHLF